MQALAARLRRWPSVRPLLSLGTRRRLSRAHGAGLYQGAGRQACMHSLFRLRALSRMSACLGLPPGVLPAFPLTLVGTGAPRLHLEERLACTTARLGAEAQVALACLPRAEENAACISRLAPASSEATP